MSFKLENNIITTIKLDMKFITNVFEAESTKSIFFHYSAPSTHFNW
jgi:hypothetical protein